MTWRGQDKSADRQHPGFDSAQGHPATFFRRGDPRPALSGSRRAGGTPTRIRARSSPLAALLIGLVATLAVALGHLAGLDDAIEGLALDARFRWFPAAPAPGPAPVHVDIDDTSIEELGRWPWPRETLAALVGSLRQAGARAIAFDIILPDPQPVRHVSAAVDVYDASAADLLGSGGRIVLDDALLTTEFRAARQANVPVVLPLHFEQREARRGPAEDDLALRVRAVLDHAPDASLADVRAAVAPGNEPTPDERKRLVRAYLRERAARALEPHAVPRTQVRGYTLSTGRMVPPMMLFAASAGEVGFVNFQPDPGGVVRRVPLLAADESGRVYPQFALAVAARELARRHCANDSLHPSRSLRAPLHRSPHDPPEDEGGRVRAGSEYTITADRRHVVIRCSDGWVRRVPVDTEGNLLLNWPEPAPAEGPRPSTGAQGGPGHPATKEGGGVPLSRVEARRIPAVAVTTAWRLEQGARENRRAWRLTCLQLARSVFSPTEASGDAPRHPVFEAFRAHQAAYDRLIAARVRRQRALLFEGTPADVPPPPTDLADAEARAEARLDETCRELIAELSDPETLAFYLGRPAAPTTVPTDGETGTLGRDSPRAAAYRHALAAYRQRVRDVTERLELLAQLDAANRRITGRIEAERAELRRRVEGRICLVGAFSTAAADFVPTPLARRTPGIDVHAAVLNTILSGEFLTRTRASTGLLVVLLSGTLVSLLTAWRSVLQAAAGLAVLAGAFLAVNVLLLFGARDVWLPVVAPLAGMLAAFVTVTAYRELTEERAKRQIRGLFARALSPALVDRLIEDPSLARLGGERREVSCFFSDLEGFTSLAERLGEQPTVRLLNHYFDHMTEVIQDHCGGYVNKFLGDGLLVFFGAPVNQADHADRAVRAGVLCAEEIARLNDELAAEGGPDGPVQLACRVGVATGEVMVGNCGSSSRMDYTAIGDTVNLASRLESANKQFGTRLLVAGEAWRQADQGAYVARRIGTVVVAGKHEPVEVWNVLALADGAEDELDGACGDFSRAVRFYEERKFSAAAELFEAAGRVLGLDAVTRMYLDRCRRLAVEPPPADWRPAIELTEK